MRSPSFPTSRRSWPSSRSDPMTAGRVLVAGASGFIGRALVRELAGKGYRVVALSRDASGTRDRFPDGVE
ncbi:MAG: NAD-dependent epimerase/dehydratase family protein, partial [Candidatus Aminicenantes bacterium RBG_16_66_30]